MRYPHIAGRLFNTPLMVKPTYATTVAHVLKARFDVAVADEAPPQPQAREAYAEHLDANGVLTIPVTGGLYNRGDDLDASSGMQSYANLTNRLVAARENAEVKAILLDIDSPGGEAAGCFSFAETIRAVGAVKPVWGHTGGDACSAAYAIGAACQKFYAAPDAEVGSIGVVMLHLDVSEAMQKAGVVATMIYRGRHKVDGHPYGPLSDGAKAELNARLDKRYEQFVSLVSRYRPLSADEVRATEARIYLGDEAAELRLIDGIASFEKVRQDLGNLQPAPDRVSRVRFKDGVIIHD